MVPTFPHLALFYPNLSPGMRESGSFPSTPSSSSPHKGQTCIIQDCYLSAANPLLRPYTHTHTRSSATKQSDCTSMIHQTAPPPLHSVEGIIWSRQGLHKHATSYNWNEKRASGGNAVSGIWRERHRCSNSHSAVSTSRWATGCVCWPTR